MLFTSPVFFGFFAVVLGLHWFVLQGQRDRKLLLLVASYVFYGAWDVRFVLLIVFSTVVDYVVALRIAGADRQPVRKRWLMLSLAANLGVLGVFKYFNFFADSLVESLRGLGVEASEVTLSITLPVGISFFTFQTMSYTIDVYRGNLEPRKHLLDVAVFVAFFPQLVAGPIVRAAHFLPQLDIVRQRSLVQWRPAVGLFFVGFFKKAVLADTVGGQIDPVFSDPQSYDAFSTVTSVFGYALQIYCDFSGYTDMAIAVAMMLGYSLGENFDFPYFSTNLTEFWRRWHISLSSWLRDYLYIPLGGNRGGVRITYRNLLITMVLGGLWHGAAWTFVFWGLLHGLGLAVHRVWNERSRPGRTSRADVAASDGARVASVVFRTAVTFIFVCCAWIFFRASSFGDAWYVLGRFLTLSGGGVASISPWIAVYIVAGAAVHWLTYRRVLHEFVAGLSVERFSLALGAATAITIALRPLGSAPFIYFQF